MVTTIARPFYPKLFIITPHPRTIVPIERCYNRLIDRISYSLMKISRLRRRTRTASAPGFAVLHCKLCTSPSLEKLFDLKRGLGLIGVRYPRRYPRVLGSVRGLRPVYKLYSSSSMAPNPILRSMYISCMPLATPPAHGGGPRGFTTRPARPESFSAWAFYAQQCIGHAATCSPHMHGAIYTLTSKSKSLPWSRGCQNAGMAPNPTAVVPLSARNSRMLAIHGSW